MRMRIAPTVQPTLEHGDWPATNQELTTMAARTSLYNAPIFLGSAFLVMGVAIVEKFLNLFGWSIPFVDVFPRQLIEWAGALLLFEIALSMRQLIELRLEERRGSKPEIPPDAN
jgi:hypothetical protein